MKNFQVVWRKLDYLVMAKYLLQTSFLLQMIDQLEKTPKTKSSIAKISRQLQTMPEVCWLCRHA